MIITESVTINAQPAKNRRVIVIDANSKVKLLSTKTDELGFFSADINVTVDSVIAIAFDDDGSVYKPSFIYEVGNSVKPSPFNGFVLDCYLSGMSSATFPEYPLQHGAMVSCGSATFIVRQYFQPVAKFIPL